MDGACSTHENKKNISGISFRKPEAKRNLGRHKGSWTRNIKILVKETW